MKRILFVDDEPNILAGLKRMLHSQRREWDMVFVSSGQEALDAMAEDPFQVVVADMRMPGMDGAELLARVKESYPGAVRIVLSAYSESEAVMRSVSVSHQFLTKPCEAEVLRATVNRACALEGILGDPDLRSLVGEVDRLPALPRVYRALTAELAKEDVELAAVGRIVEEDVGISAKILQLVNSSFFGIRREMTDLRQAVSYLGIATVRDLALAFGVFQEFESGSLPGFSIEREQSHSLLVARIAKRLMTEKAASEEAFLAAMLHDVGKLVLATRRPEALKETLLAARSEPARPLHVVEEETLGASHAEIGGYLLGLWGMPYPVVEAVVNHHYPGRVEDHGVFGTLGATHVANALAYEVAGEGAGESEVDLEYLEMLGVADKLPEWRAIAEEECGVTERV